MQKIMDSSLLSEGELNSLVKKRGSGGSCAAYLHKSILREQQYYVEIVGETTHHRHFAPIGAIAVDDPTQIKFLILYYVFSFLFI